MSLDFNLRRLGLTKQSKILNLTHDNCMDGTISSIVLDNIFRNITFIRAAYNNIDEILSSIIQNDYDKYDFIFITDISPKDPELLKNKNKIILLDHHNTAKYHHNPEENKYVVDYPSGSKLVKKFLEVYFGLPISHLTRLVNYSSDYDSWARKYAMSTFLNEIHFQIFPERFQKRFFSGNTRLKKEEIEYIRSRKKQFGQVYDNLEIYELNKIKGCYIEANEFINELCSKLLDEKYDIVFCKNGLKNSVSVRCKKGFVNVGEVLKELGYGGGHAEAGAFLSKDFSDYKQKIEKIEERIYKEIKRRK